MNRRLKIFVIIITLIIATTSVFGDCEDIKNVHMCTNKNECSWDGEKCHTKSKWWTSAQTFFNDSYGYDKNTKKESLDALNEIIDLIKVIGNAVFIIVTIVLGIKYMLASSEGKADVKEGITGLVVAILLFYGWTALDGILRNSLGWFFEKGTTPTDTVNRIFDFAKDILNYISVGVVLFVGVKFLLSGAEGKADLKGKGIPFVIGLVMTFGTITFLTFIINVINDVI